MILTAIIIGAVCALIVVAIIAVLTREAGRMGDVVDAAGED